MAEQKKTTSIESDKAAKKAEREAAKKKAAERARCPHCGRLMPKPRVLSADQKAKKTAALARMKARMEKIQKEIADAEAAAKAAASQPAASK